MVRLRNARKWHNVLLVFEIASCIRISTVSVFVLHIVFLQEPLIMIQRNKIY